MKIEEKQILPKDKVIARLREVADALEGGTFTFGEQAIALPDAAELEVEYKAHKGKEKLVIEAEWRTPGAVRTK